MKARYAWVTLYGLSSMIACGPSARQLALCDLQKNVGALEQRLRHSEAYARALDERLVVLDAREAQSPSETAPEPAAKGAATSASRDVTSAPLEIEVVAPPARATMPDEGISLSTGKSLASCRSVRLYGPKLRRAAGVPNPNATSQLPKRLQKALRVYQEGAFAQAFGQFAGFVRTNPKHPAADRARFWMGECKFEQGALMESIAQFARLEREHPQSPKTPEALLKMGLAFEKLRAPDEAFATWRRLIQSFPGSASAELASTRLRHTPPKSPAL